VHNYLATCGAQGFSSEHRGGMVSQVPAALTSPPQAIFAGDLAPWQTRAFQGGTHLPIRVRFQNTGSSSWPLDTHLVFVDGENMGGARQTHMLADPGNFVEIVLILRVPDSEGAHMGTWRLACSAGYFGEPLYMIVNSHPSAAPVSFSPQDYVNDTTQQSQAKQQQEAQFDQLMSSVEASLTVSSSRFNVGGGSGNDNMMGE